jgi:hypothetical protein
LLGNCGNEEILVFLMIREMRGEETWPSVIPSRRKIIKRASFKPRYNAVKLLPLGIKTQMISNGLPLQKYMSHTPVSLP